MSIIVACPSCGGKLRVADELRGQAARCPACNHVFDTPQAPEPRDLPLELTIDEPSQPRSAPANQTPGLVGAVELKLSLDDEPSSPPPRTPEPPRETPRPAPRLADEHDDLKTCPTCGKHVHRDSSRCYHCGQRFDGRPSERKRSSVRLEGPRRDAEPDRGATVLTLGIISLVCLVISCVPVGAIFGLIAWIMGRGDLHKIRRGEMDPNGQGMTQAGWICGILGTALNGLATLGCLGLFAFVIYEENHRTWSTTKPAKAAPFQQNPKFPGRNRR
jgi:hypothetical protein